MKFNEEVPCRQLKLTAIEIINIAFALQTVSIQVTLCLDL